MIAPTVISKGEKAYTFTVRDKQTQEEITLSCTPSESRLIEVGKKYGALTYVCFDKNYINGHLSFLFPYP